MLAQIYERKLLIILLTLGVVRFGRGYMLCRILKLAIYQEGIEELALLFVCLLRFMKGNF